MLPLLIKPASGACDLNCRYCFYREETAHRAAPLRGMMSRATAQRLILRAKEASRDVLFAFQGGEPTLAGLDFFRWFTETARSVFADGRVQFSIQTNGRAIDEAFAEFFARERYLVGLSLDGPRDIHDKNRDKSFDAAIRALQLLQRAGAETNVLSVVTAQMAKRPQAVYEWMKKQGIFYQQFIPCLPPLSGEPHTPWALTASDWGGFLCKLFDLWYADLQAGVRVSNRLFENWAAMAACFPPEECGIGGACAPQYVIEADGAVYPCDFYCLDEWQLGAIQENSFSDMDAKREALGFLTRPLLHPDCKQCRAYSLCRGGCPRYRDESGRNVLCSGYRRFFDYAGPRLLALARTMK